MFIPCFLITKPWYIKLHLYVIIISGNMGDPKPTRLPALAVYCFCIIIYAAVIGLLIANLVIICQIKNGMIDFAGAMLSSTKEGGNLAERGEYIEEYQITDLTLGSLLTFYTNQTCMLKCYS